MIGQAGDSLRVQFHWRDEAMRERMVVKLFASGAHEVGLRQASVAQILLATWRRAFGATWLEGYKTATQPAPAAEEKPSAPTPRRAAAG